MIKFIRRHGTKVIGFAQVTVGVLATATDLFSPDALKWILLVNGLLVAWRGYFNTLNTADDDGSQSGA